MELIKIYKFNLKLDQLEKSEDISKVVDKLLLSINEEQIYSNEISEYIKNYFENKRNKSHNKKQNKILNNYCYQSEILQKIMFSNNNKKKIKDRNLVNDKSNIINKINRSVFVSLNKNRNRKNHRKSGENMEEKYNSMVKSILNMSRESFNEKEYNYMSIINKRNMKRIASGKISTPTIFKSKSLFINKNGKNINLQKYLNQLSRDTSFIKDNLSIKKSPHSLEKFAIIDLKKNTTFKKNDDILSKDDSFHKLTNKISIFASIKLINSKSLIKNHRINSAKDRKEQYRNDRAKYIIKNTRLLFTKNKNLDKIVRKKKSK